MPDLEITAAPNGPMSLGRPHFKGHKTLPRSRKPGPYPVALLANTPSILPTDEKVDGVDVPVTPTLPLTPPNQIQDDDILSDSAPQLNTQHVLPLKQNMATPTTSSHQFSPPTPDVTPPRVKDTTPKARPAFNSLQSSMSSRADSFQTARENVSDDDVVEGLYPSAHSLVVRKRNTSLPDPATHSNEFHSMDDSTEEEDSPKSLAKASNMVPSSPLLKPQLNGQHQQDGLGGGLGKLNVNSSAKDSRLQSKSGPGLSSPLEMGDQNNHSDLTNNEQKLMDRVNTWRFSGSSFTSTIEAIVIETAPPKQRALRHTEKKTSLRSVSSPQPKSTRTSTEPNVDSPRRLVHKSLRISNQNRNSAASDMSIPTSTASSYRQAKPEVIPVVIVPQRQSSLHTPASSSRNQSVARSETVTSTRRNKSVSRSGSGDQSQPRRKRTVSDSGGSIAGHSGKEDRGRGMMHPLIPARSSSLSAPTSRSNSRATSLTSESLRRHTEAMKLAVEVPKKNEISGLLPSPKIVLPGVSNTRYTDMFVPTSPKRMKDDLELLHAPSLHFTQSSVVSSSPGPIEIREATMVTYFPHNNDSLLVVNSYIQPQSEEVKTLQDQTYNEPVAVWTPEQSMAAIDVESPLRNPRTPPVPPTQKAVSQAPMNDMSGFSGRPVLSREGSSRSRIGRNFGSVKRALSARRNSDTVRQQPVARSLSTKSAINRRAEKARDSQLYSFWKPRGFWDDFDSPGNERNDRTAATVRSGQQGNEEDTFVGNSLGLPQKRVIFSGPMVLARRISNSKKFRCRGPKRYQYSHSDLNLAMGIPRPHSPYQHRTIKLRLQRGIFFPVRVLRDARQRAKETRQMRASARLEARRERLKQSIGAKKLTDPYSVGPFSHGAPYDDGNAIQAVAKPNGGLY